MKRWRDDRIPDLLVNFGIEDPICRVRSHPTCIRPPVFVKDRLVVLRRDEGQGMNPIGKDQEGNFLSLQKFFQNDSFSSRPQDSFLHKFLDG